MPLSPSRRTGEATVWRLSSALLSGPIVPVARAVGAAAVADAEAEAEAEADGEALVPDAEIHLLRGEHVADAEEGLGRRRVGVRARLERAGAQRLVARLRLAGRG